ncbi:MAG: hypothetical protein WB710_12360, partial [Stellaceae bacterium]
LHFGAEDLVFEVEIRDLPVFGVEHGDGHRRVLSREALVAKGALLTASASPCHTGERRCPSLT